ncbi:MAG: serine hydroxymethyltransferase [Elusimicrobia bacterium GWC2_65_9]|nr:MAG: serine hydroxymethyltransferase [Elusimicrobia bacterium GWA2_66_18]OGR69004.1 MAG: serine hydroxymethyltransferase [Elusimicrobia bacterium GWC2_65_9]
MSTTLAEQDPELHAAIVREARRQSDNLELIASENYASEAVLEAQGSLLTNKYAEGYPGKRYYGGCEFVDQAEALAIDRAKKLFGAEHANVQPHSGSQANMAMYLSVLKPGDTVMGLNLAHGGHLSHGHPMNFSGKHYKIAPIDVRKDDELIDYDKAAQDAREQKPKIVFMGASNYSRVIDWTRLKKIADDVGALFAADIAHYAGLIAAGVYPSPVGAADFTTTTTHKTLRGPRGGMVMCKTAHAAALDKMVFPGIQGGPLMHVVAAKAVCFGEALRPEFKQYQTQVIANARRLSKSLADQGFRIVAGGTDCHLFSLDLRPKSATGKEAEEALDKAGITVNKNAIPYDPQKPFIASGVRIGTPALTTRGMKEAEMDAVAGLIDEALKVRADDAALKRVKEAVTALCRRFPIYPGIMRSVA